MNTFINNSKRRFSPSFLALLITFMFFCIAQNVFSANRFSVATGNWNSTACWAATSGGASGASFPVAGDVVTIEGGFNITVNVVSACASITIGTATAGTLTLNTNALTLTGDLIVQSGAGTGTFTGGTTAALTLGGNLTVNTGATFTPPSTLTTIYTLSGATKTIGGTIAAITIPTLAVSGTIANDIATLTVSTGLTGAGTLTNNANKTLNIGAVALSLTITSLVATAVANTVNYNLAGAQTVKGAGAGGTNYYNLTLSGSGAKTLLVGTTAITGNLTLSGTATATTVVALVVSGNLSIGDGTTLTLAGFAFTVNGTTTVGAGASGTLTTSSSTGTKLFVGLVTISSGSTAFGAASCDATFRGGITTNHATTTTFGAGVMTFDTNPQSITNNGTGLFTIPNVTVTGIILTNTCPTAARALSVTTALTGTGELAQAASAYLTIGGTSATISLTASATGNTVEYSSAAAAQTMAGLIYYNLTCSGAGQKDFGASTTVANDFNMTTTSGHVYLNLANNGRTLAVANNFTDASTVGGLFILQNLVGTYGATVTVGATTTVSGAGGIFFHNTSGSATVACIFTTVDFVSSSTSANAVNFGNSTTAISNQFRISGNLTHSSTGLFAQSSTTAPNGGFYFTGTGNTQILNYSGANSIDPSYTVNSGAYLQLAAGLVLGNGTTPYSTFTVNGTLDAQTFVISGGSATVAALNTGFTLASGATLKTKNITGITSTITDLMAPSANYNSAANYVFNGTANQTATNFVNSTMNNLTIINSGGVGANTVTLSAAATVNGTLTLTSGLLLTTPANLITVTNTANTAVTGAFTAASPYCFINGPLKWNLSAAADSWLFPVGVGTVYYPFTLAKTSLTTTTIQVETKSATTGSGVPTSPLTLLSTTEYWSFAVTTASVTGSVSLTRQTVLGDMTSIAISPSSILATGPYTTLGGTAGSPNYSINTSNATIIPSGQTRYFVMSEACAVPSIQATNVTVVLQSYSTALVSWTNGNGSGRLVIAKPTSAPTASPCVNGTFSYVANADVTAGGTSLGGGLVVYIGTGSSFTATNLTATTTYYFEVYEYNCQGSAKVNYNNNTATGNPFTRSPATWMMGSSATIVRAGPSTTSSDNWQLGYGDASGARGNVANIPSTAYWIIRTTDGGVSSKPTISTVQGGSTGSYYPNLTIENTSAGNWVTPSLSRFKGSTGGYATIKGNLDVGGAGPGTVTFVNDNLNASQTIVKGNATIETGSTMQSSGTGYQFEKNFTNNGTYSYNVGVGTISTTAGSATVTGVSTLFTDELIAGSILLTPGTIASGGGVVIGTVSAIGTNTSLTLTANAATTFTGISFTNGGKTSATTYPATTEVFKGTTAQNLGGTSISTFYNLTIQNTHGYLMDNGVTLSSVDEKVNNVLAFTDGQLNLNMHTIEVTNPATTAITRTNGYAVSETNVAINNSCLQWDIGTTTGSHIYPFGTYETDGTAGHYIPVTFNNKGNSSGNTKISTRRTLTTDNKPWAGASDATSTPVAAVTDMNDAVIGGDGSVKAVIDRWWDIEVHTGTGTPSIMTGTGADVTFSYWGPKENTLSSPCAQVGDPLWVQHWDGTAWDKTLTGATDNNTGVHSATGASLKAFSPELLTDAVAPLPIELLSFNAEYNGEFVETKWVTATELNNDYFTVERSTNGIEFVFIGNFASKAPGGNSTSNLNYTLNDKDVTTGIYYYRLKQTDFDGSYKYSDIAPVKIEEGSAGVFVVKPNPTQSAADIEYHCSSSEKAFLKVFDYRGRVIINKEINCEKGQNISTIDLSNETDGIYIITMTVNEKVYKTKLIKGK
jgi:hypothetical protein